MKILKNIPGYKAGEIIESETDNSKERVYEVLIGRNVTYMFNPLIEQGYAEIVKDDIDIESIRDKYRSMTWDGKDFKPVLQIDESLFFNAYRIVKTVIDQLNGDWKPDWNDEDQNKNLIIFNVETQKFNSDNWFSYNPSILGVCKNKNVSEKVIKLCEPELKVLFGIK